MQCQLFVLPYAETVKMSWERFVTMEMFQVLINAKQTVQDLYQDGLVQEEVPLLQERVQVFVETI